MSVNWGADAGCCANVLPCNATNAQIPATTRSFHTESIDLTSFIIFSNLGIIQHEDHN